MGAEVFIWIVGKAHAQGSAQSVLGIFIVVTRRTVSRLNDSRESLQALLIAWQERRENERDFEADGLWTATFLDRLFRYCDELQDESSSEQLRVLLERSRSGWPMIPPELIEEVRCLVSLCAAPQPLFAEIR